MKDYKELAARMKADWDRRVSHDYRFWMSDGYQSDQDMWESGQRDFEILSRNLQVEPQSVYLELGCGVGRLLRPAASKFDQLIGIDVSESAVKKARELLSDLDRLTVHVGNGYDLQPVPDASVDVVSSFAALTSIPTEVIANYLCEINRVLKDGGIVRLQCYLGVPQDVRKDDTLHLRCYERARFISAVVKAGFKVEWIEELVLPFQVSFKEIGIEAVIVSLQKISECTVNAEEISETLLPEGEIDHHPEMSGKELEYWMTVNYARELVKLGDVDSARNALEFAAAHASTVAIDVGDLLNRIVQEVREEAEEHARSGSVAPANDCPAASIALGEPGAFRILEDRFPEVARVYSQQSNATGSLECRESSEGSVLFLDGQCLDHVTKPRTAAAAWARSVASEARVRDAGTIVVYGFGCGYHIEALLDLVDTPIRVIEPSLEVFRAACEVRDQSQSLTRLFGLHVGQCLPQDFGENAELVVRPQTQLVSGEFLSQVKSQLYGRRGLSTLTPKIGVLGPLQGGTLHMSAYVARGLAAIDQRVRLIDTQCFAEGYGAIESFLSEKTRRGVVENAYIETVSEVVLQSILEKPVDILIVMALAPISGRVLTELRKRGIITVHWFVEDHLRFTYWQQVAQYYDFMFTIQRGECIDRIKAAGAGEVHYLPTACDPVVHAPMMPGEQERERWGSPISFVGAGYHNRQQMFAALAKYPFKIWGTEWPECKPFDSLVQEEGRRVTPAEYVKIFNTTDININLHSSSERDGVDPYGDFLNPRTFELASCGAFQLVDERSLLPEAFEYGKEIITFKDIHDLKDKIAYYMDRPGERQEVADRARERVLRDHTYARRLETMLSIIYSSKYDSLIKKQHSSPWVKMLERAKPHEELHERCVTSFERGEEPNLDGLVADIVTGEGKLTDTEKKLLFLFHVRKQIVTMRREGDGKPELKNDAKEIST